MHPHLCHTGKAKKTVFCTLCHTDKASEKATRTLCHLDKANEKADKAFCHLDKANEKADKALCHTDKTYETAAKTLCNFDKHRERLTPLALTVRQRHRKVRTPHFSTPAKAYLGLYQRYREILGSDAGQQEVFLAMSEKQQKRIQQKLTSLFNPNRSLGFGINSKRDRK